MAGSFNLFKGDSCAAPLGRIFNLSGIFNIINKKNESKFSFRFHLCYRVASNANIDSLIFLFCNI